MMNGKERGNPKEIMQYADMPDDCGVHIINSFYQHAS